MRRLSREPRAAAEENVVAADRVVRAQRTAECISFLLSDARVAHFRRVPATWVGARATRVLLGSESKTTGESRPSTTRVSRPDVIFVRDVFDSRNVCRDRNPVRSRRPTVVVSLVPERMLRVSRTRKEANAL